ncbi:MAG: T9SS type A sorting domain-containing protein [Bacteroidota bacterium]|nr:T9SS type A sorting domain-containing protein [Bacteroidota bacterium]
MKSYKILTLLLVGLLFASFSFVIAGEENKTSGVQQLKRPVDSGVMPGRESAPMVEVDQTLATPEPTKTEAVRLSKIAAPVGPYSGTYTIPGDFATITEAVILLNSYGLAGPTTFELWRGSYTETGVTIGSYTGNSNLLTITPNAGLAVTINWIATSSAGKGFAFNNAKNVTIEGVNAGSSLTLQWASGYPFPLGDPFGATVYITNKSENITVNNTHIKGQINNAVWDNQTEARPAAFVFRAATDGAPNKNVRFDGCTFTNASFGIKVLSSTWPRVVLENYYVENCFFGNAYGGYLLGGQLVDLVYNVQMKNCIVDGIRYLPYYWNLPSATYTEYDFICIWAAKFLWGFGQATGFHYLVVHGGLVQNNIIRNVEVVTSGGDGIILYATRTYGFNLGSLSPSYTLPFRPDLVQNRVYNLWNDDGVYAGRQPSLQGFRGPGMNAYYNSVQLTGNTTTNVGSTCSNIGDGLHYNNAYSNEITGNTTASRCVPISVGGTYDNNALHFPLTGWATSAHATIPAAVGAGINPNGVWSQSSIYFTSDLHVDGSQATIASNIGRTAGVPVLPDIDNQIRSTTTPDAGADEFPDAPLSAVDVFPASIPSPASGGVPAGVAVVPSVLVKNNSNSPQTFNVSLAISSGEGVYATPQQVSYTIPSNGSLTQNFPAWTPIGGGDRTLTATTLLPGDVVPGNDSLSRTQPVVPPVVLTEDYFTNFNTAGARTGWSATGDFAAAGAGGWTNTNFTKLGGAYNDAAPASRWSWVSKPGPASPGYPGYSSATAMASRYYHSDRMLSQVISPFFDLSGMTGEVYVSFVHSVDVEAMWERAWMWYTSDGGTSWHVLGNLNDPTGINWYDDKVYKNALSGTDGASCLDLTNWNLLVGLPVPQPGWSSNYASGTCGEEGAAYWDADGNTGGPHGWVYVQLKLPAHLQRSPLVRFAYASFADAWYCDDGWAFDAFKIGTPGTFTGGTISGTVFHDLNGNAVIDGGEPDGAGTKVYLSYFGVLKDSTLTNASGIYTFDATKVNLPGIYNIRAAKPGYAWTLPFGTTGIADVNHPATGEDLIQNLGYYQGFVTGLKFNDLNNNGVFDSEPPLSGWTIQLHKDSANGPMIGSAVTAADGNYTLLAPAYFWGAGNPGNYVVKEIAKPSARQTFPAPPRTHTVQMTGTSGPTNIVPDKNFGNFLYAILVVEALVDRNGNGIKELEDQFFIPEGQGKMSYELWKGATRLDSFYLADGLISKTFYTIDTGTYTIKRVTPVIPNWIETFPSEKTIVITSSEETPFATFGYFKYVTVTGKKFESTEGNPGLEGWTINITGGTYFGSNSALTAGDGTYSIDSIGPGFHTINEVLQSGWTRVVPASPYTFPAYSGHLAINNPKDRDFGNFKNVSISGVKYRDYNGNCIVDGNDFGMADWNITLNPGAQTVVTGVNGAYSFSNLGPGTYTICEEVKEGFVANCDTCFEVTVVSGTDVTGINFFNSQPVDEKWFTTFICPPVEDAACAKTKPVKDWTAKKPTVPNYANLVAKLVNKVEQLIFVGKSGQMNAGNKEKAYFWPKAYGDVWKTLCDKLTRHTDDCQLARGFDTDVKGKLMLKRWKSVSPNKKNDILVQELTILDINIWASVKGITPTGFGDLCYYEPGNALHGMSINAIAAYADEVMTNWEGVPFTIYQNLCVVIKKLNEAFYDDFNYDVAQWNVTTSVLYFPGVRPLYEVDYLRSCTSPAPAPTPPAVEPLPTVYALGQNYPNPFNPTTTVSFDLPFTSIVTLKIYNMLGQEVGTLLNREEFEAGAEEVEFDASTLASGIYLYRIVAEQIDDEGVGQTFTQVKKMVLVK